MPAFDTEIEVHAGYLSPFWQEFTQLLFEGLQHPKDDGKPPHIEMRVTVGDTEVRYVFTGDVDTSVGDIVGEAFTTTWRPFRVAS